MATIKPTTKGGYQARIQKRQGGTLVFDRSQNFSSYALAKAWADEVEAQIAKDGLIATLNKRMTFGGLIQLYFDKYDPIKEFGRNKRFHLRQLQSSSLGALTLDRLDTQAVMDFIYQRQLSGTGSTTINLDLTWIRIVARHAPAFGYSAHMQQIEDAILLARSDGSATRSNQRARRPTNEELWRLSDYFNTRRTRGKASSYPMYDIMWFAIHSARRQAEIARIEKADNSPADKTGIVRDLKHPRKKQGNHQRFKYTALGWEIAHAQKSDSPLIFPHSAKTIGENFRRGCKFCGIEDLRFHDLRHEATSRLFEDGLNIPDVAHITLHQTWEMLRRYTHLGTPKQRLIWSPGKPKLATIKQKPTT